MAAFNRIDALLNGLHFTDADVLVQFGEAPTEHAHVHSSLLAAECPNFDVLGAPISFEGIRVFAVAFKYGTCTLEPLTTWSVLSTDAMCHRFHDSSLAPEGWSDARDDSTFKGQTARNQNLYAKRQYITILKILYKIPVSLDDLEPYASRDTPVARLHSISTSAMETCARAEALGCLEKVADVLIGLLLECSLLGQCVAQTPVKFIKLAQKVRSKKLYFIATRYIAPDAKLTKNWFDGSTYYDINSADLATALTVVFGKESAAAKKLLDSLLDIQLCRQHMSKHIQPHLRQYSVPCFECIARTHFAEWLSESLSLSTSNVPAPNSDCQPQQAPTFETALRQVLRFAATAMPFQIFGASSNAHKMLAGELGLRDDQRVEKGIKHYLDVCVKEAATAIEQAFAASKTELTEANFPALGGASSKAPQRAQPLTSVVSSAPKAVAKQSSNRNGDATSSSNVPQQSAATALSGSISVPTIPTQATTAPPQPPTLPALQARNISPAASDLPQPPRPDQQKDEVKWRSLQVALAEDSDRTDYLDEGRLPQSLLDEFDEPSDERWNNGPQHYHRCCGAKKAADEAVGAHKCRKVDVKASYHWGLGGNGDESYAAGFAEFQEEIKKLGMIKYARVRDIIGPNELFVEQSSTLPQRFHDYPPEETEKRALMMKQAMHQALRVECGADASVDRITQYQNLAGLGSHDLSAMREILGEPVGVSGIALGNDFWNVLFGYHGFTTSYESGFHNIPIFDAHIEVCGADKLVRMSWDTPFIRGLPVTITTKENVNGGLVETNVRKTFEDPFILELDELYMMVTEDKAPKTSAEDAAKDIELWQMIIRAAARDHPS
ncbi:unnamed protein product [Cercospora beticola]|nr:unnamed protein product [Cercospora beticola]